jgi:hypothetical protein
MRVLVTTLFVTLLASTGQAQQTPAAGTGASSCRFRLNHVGGVGRQVVTPSGDTTFYANGGVELMCADSSARIASDSVALTGRGRSNVVEFIGHVRYEDSLTTQTADHGVYYRNGERWEARGRVATVNRRDGSTIQGPALDYFREVPGLRDSVEMYAVGRPTIRSFPRDTGAVRPEPYVIVADRVRMIGNDRTWAGGSVTIDRSDFAARADSLFLDTGAGNRGQLLGKPVMRGLGRDSFELRGRRIDLALDHQQITYVEAINEGHAISKDIDLVGDTIGLHLTRQQLVQTVAWGDSIKPHAVTADYEIRGDSVAFDTPEQQLREIRAFRKAWVGGKVDSVSRDRDWLTGDTVIAEFTERDSAGTRRTVLQQVTAAGSARSFYRIVDRNKNQGLPSINYARGDRITVSMKTEGPNGVDRVKIDGHVDGVNLEPLPPAIDTATVTPPVRGQR